MTQKKPFQVTGVLEKMRILAEAPLRYQLCVDDTTYDINAMIGRRWQLSFEGAIACIYCGRGIQKTFNQGYCFPC